MCMILDTNMYGLFLKDNPDMRPIHEWLDKTGRLVYSDHAQIKKEIKGKMRLKFKELSSAGKARNILEKDVEKEMQKLKNSRYNLKSNDLPILGLFQASGAKLLCTSDRKLQKDFKKLFKTGIIYKNRNHKHFLQENTCP